MVVRILAYADNDTTSGAKAVLAAMFKVPDVNCYTFVGDGPYSDDATKWIDMMKQHFTDDIVNNRSMWSQGNHEHPESESQEAEDQIEEWIPYLNNSEDQLDWLVAKQFGNVYIICGNTQDEEIEFPRKQFEWLKAELQKAKQLRAEGKIDWIVYACHKPFFTLKTNHSPYTAVRFQYKDIFRDAQVDFVLHGHNHNTQLWKPMIPNQSTANGEGSQLFTLAADGKTFDFTKDHGACYIVTGHAGHEWNSINDSGSGVNNVMHYRDSGKFGFTQLDFDGKKVNVKSIDSDGKVHFEYNVTREGTTTPPPDCPAGQCKDPTTGQCRPPGINETIGANGVCEPITVPPPPVGIDQQKALNFIKNSYKSNIGLLEEAPGFNVYWLWNDQLLGEMCLRHIDPALAVAVENKMNSFGVSMKTPWATLNPKYRNNFSVKTASEPTISTNPPIRYSDYNGNSEFSVNDYADIAFLSAIHYHYLGDTTKSQQAYNAGKAMWDGNGMKDKGNITGEYALYKVALGLLAQKITGGAPIGIPDNYFGRFQAANGGFTTDLTGGQPQGSQNIETTAAVLFAMNPSLLPTGTVPPNKPPVANAGPDQAVKPNDLVMLNGSLSTDPDGTILTSYKWTQTGGQQVDLKNGEHAIAHFTAPSQSPGIRTFTLTVTDTQGATATDTVDINVVNVVPPPEEQICPENYHYDKNLKRCIPDLEPQVPPKCPAGTKWNSIKKICEKIDVPPPPPNDPQAIIKPDNLTGQAGTIITVDGSQSKNANTYLWSTSPPTSIIGSNSGQTVQVQLPSDHTSPSSITLTVTNGTKSNSITKNITVTQIPPPPDCPSGQCKDSTTGQCRPIGADEFKDEFGMCKKKPTTGDEFDEHGTLLLTSKIGAKITGQKVTMEVGSNHRNGQRYNVNHKFINYMGLGYIKTSPNQNTQSSKLDGPNHGSCKSLPKCCWLDAEIETDTFKSRLGSEWPHPDPHDYNAQSVKELNINVRDKWIGWCTINFENKDGWRELYLFGNPNPFLPDGKPNNAGWVEMLHEVDTGQITNNELAKRKMFTEDRGLEYELRCQNAGGDGHGDTTDMKWFYVWEITPPS